MESNKGSSINMYILIWSDGWGSFIRKNLLKPPNADPQEIAALGLQPDGEMGQIYGVIDREKFFLAAIKYGIEFEQVKKPRLFNFWK